MLIKGFEMKTESLFYKLYESEMSHACLFFFGAGFLLLLVFTNLLAVNSPMTRRQRSSLTMANVAAFCLATLTAYHLSVNVTREAIEASFSEAC